MEDRAGGMSSTRGGLGGGTELDSFFVAEARRLQFEHRMISAAGRHQLIVRAQLDHLAMLQNANPVGMAHRRKAMRNQNGSRVARRGQNPLENLRLAAHVQLGGGFIEQHDSRSKL